MNEIQIFNHEEFGEIRTIEIDGQIYFVGVDVAKALKFKDPSRTLRRHVDEEDKRILNTRRSAPSNTVTFRDGISGRGNPNITVINESGLYSLVLASRIPGAKKFKHWVTSEVLPTIRKTGSYNPNPPKLEYNPYIYIENFINQGEIIMKETQEKNNHRKIGERTHIYYNADGSTFGKKVVNKFSDGSKNAVWFLFDPTTNSFHTKAGLSGKIAPLYNANLLHNNQDKIECSIVIV